MSYYWNIPKIWKGETAFIIGGGRSILSQFNIPNEIAEKVNNKKLKLSAFSRYMRRLHKRNVIGVNVAYQLGNWVDFVYFTDFEFVQLHKNKLRKHKGVKVTGNRESSIFDFCKIVLQPETPNGICDKPNTVYQNRNSGAGAINLAYHLGATRIVLIGFDGIKIDDKIHFHSEYENTILENIQHPITTKHQPYKEIKDDADRLGIEIINTSFASSIKEFKKEPIEKIFLIK
jgi:hypothetical protein